MATMYYSPSNNRLYGDDIFGTLTIQVPDPSWVRPLLPNGTPNWSAQPNMITVANPNCTLPSDVIALTASQYQVLMTGIAAGQYLTPGTNNFPTTVAPAVIPPTPAQQAASAIAAGVVITSTATPTLNGTYSCSGASQANINATITYILLNSTFPGSGSSMPWIDQAGSPHVFPSITEFKAFATAIASYVASVSIYGDSNGTIGSLPSNQIAIP